MKILQTKFVPGNREQRKRQLISFPFIVSGGEEESVTENNLVKESIAKKV